MKIKKAKFNILPKTNISLTCGLVVLFLLTVGCSHPPGKSIPPAYLGVWTAQDGSQLIIRSDGSGDYEDDSSLIENMTVEIDETAREINFRRVLFGQSKFRIDEPPTENKMKVNGKEYRRANTF